MKNIHTNIQKKILNMFKYAQICQKSTHALYCKNSVKAGSLVPPASLPLSMQITGIDEGLAVKQVCIDFLDKVFLLTYERGSKTVSL